MAFPAWMTVSADAVSVSLKVHPRAPKTEIGPAMGAQLKVKVTAPPVDAAANEAVVRLFADSLDCSRGAITILRGATSRSKVLRICGVDPSRVAALGDL